MTTPLLISPSSAPIFISLHTLSVLLDVTERRVQQLAAEGIVIRKRQGHYDLVASIQGYVRYLRAQAQKKASSEAELKKLFAYFDSPSEERGATLQRSDDFSD